MTAETTTLHTADPARLPSGGTPACRCEFYAACEQAGEATVHDQLLADLGGQNGIEGITRFAEHLALTDECDEPNPRMRWNEVALFVAQHNWPDPVSTYWLSTVLADWRRYRFELNWLERQSRALS